MINPNDIYGLGQSIAVCEAKRIVKDISAEDLRKAFQRIQNDPVALMCFLDGMHDSFGNAYFSLTNAVRHKN